MTAIRISVLLAAFLCSSAFALTKETPPGVNESNKSVVINNSAPDFQLRLPANPTTGYSWFLKSYDHKLLHVIRNSYEAPQSTLLGAGGVSIWSFRAVPEAFKVPQVTEIVLIYMRPGDVKSGDVKTYTIVTYPCHPGTKDHSMHHYQCS